MKNNRLTTHIASKRDSWLEINLNAIEHNVGVFKSLLKNNAKLLGVVKADAYGCGASMISKTLLACGVDLFGVASIDEGIELRKNNIKAPILVLGASPIWAFDYAIYYDIMISIFSSEHIQACKEVYDKTGIKPKVHIKIDSGMNRIGVIKDFAFDFIHQVKNSEFIDLKGIFTHLACAENVDITNKQIKCFYEIINQFDLKNIDIHFLNTCGIICYNNLDYNMARLGIGIYGFLPDLPENIKIDKSIINLKNVISLKSRIVNLHCAKENEGISYSYTYKTDKPTKIATIPLGYADGISRGLSNRLYGLLNGQLIKQVGNITMDQMMFDVSNIDCTLGDIITLLGSSEENENLVLNIDDWAKKLNTIHYELICRLKVRLTRIYTR